MKYKAEIHIMPKAELLDPQGRTVSNNLKMAGIEDMSNVRIGKHVQLDLAADSSEDAYTKVDEACKKLFVNLITESYKIVVKENK